jgi:hypothetical protein
MALLAGTEQEPQVQASYSEQGPIKGHRQCTRALDARELAESERALRATMTESRIAEQRRVGAKARRAKIAMF